MHVHVHVRVRVHAHAHVHMHVHGQAKACSDFVLRCCFSCAVLGIKKATEIIVWICFLLVVAFPDLNK